jgi:REP element-mobilizing transposase RayT
MAKIPRTHIEGAVYYVTSRGDNEEEIFKNDEDYKKYLELLKKYKEQYGFKLFAFVLMPTHLHLLIGLKEGLTISDIMHDLNANYTKYFNAKRQRKGHLFQERYKMNLLEKTPYLLSYMVAYLHLNPKTLGLVTEINDYVYSSYVLYIGKEGIGRQLNMQDEIKEVLKYLEGKDYAAYLKAIPQEEMQAFGRDLEKKPILGSNEFIEKVQSEIEAQQQTELELASSEAGTPNRKLILIGTIAIVILGVSTVYLVSTARGMKENLKRELTHKEIELSTKLAQDREFIKKDLDEKYRADLVSYEAMAKRLEIEKSKVKNLESAINKK